MATNIPKQMDKYKSSVQNWVCGAIEDYYSHRCFKSLKKRVNKLSNSIDMLFGNESSGTNRPQNQFKSNIAIPLAREAFVARRSITSSVFTSPDLITVYPDGYTPWENARNMQDVMIAMLKSTGYIQNTLQPIIDSVSRWGVGVAVTSWDTKERYFWRTTEKRVNDMFMGYERIQDVSRKKGCYATPINILNYFQQPDQPDYLKARYRGYKDRLPLHKLIRMAKENPDVYIKDAVIKLIKDAEKGSVGDKNYYNNKQQSLSQLTYVDISHYYGTLDFEGNREDDTIYYIQECNGNIIRIQENPYDENRIPIDVFRMDPRPEFFWGNAEPENVMPMENYLQFAFSTFATSALQEMQRYIFYDTASGLDITRIQNAAKSSGFVGVDKKPNQKMSDILYQHQFPSVSTSNLQYIANEMKEAAQRSRTKADFSRQENEGGLRNKTATAANIMANQGNVQEQYYLTQFSYGLINNMRTMLVLLKQHAGNVLLIDKPPTGKIELLKRQILGDFNPELKTSLTQNTMNQVQKLLNIITAVQNFKGSGDPAIMRFNIAPYLREWAKLVSDNISVDSVYPEISQEEQMAMQQPQQPQIPVQPQPQPQQQGVPVNA